MTLKTREKILIISVAIAISIWAFDRFYYTPQKAKILGLKKEVKTADLRLRDSVIFVAAVDRLEAEVSRLDGELQGLQERMHKGEEFRAFLKHLAIESDRLEMKIISLFPKEENITEPEQEKEGTNFQYKKVSVKMVFHSTYSKLGIYLKRIEGLPFLITVDSLRVEREEEIFPRLKVTLELGMHIISL